MLNRRHLRIKVLQELYSFFQSGSDDLAVAEKNIFRDIDKIYELYIFLFLFFRELAEYERGFTEERTQQKFYTKNHEQNPEVFSQLSFIRLLQQDKKFNIAVLKTKTNWQSDHEWVKNIFTRIRKSPEYINASIKSASDEIAFLGWVLEKMMAGQEDFRNALEEKNIQWSEEFDFVCISIERAIADSVNRKSLQLLRLYRDEKEDKDFVRDLFLKTILHSEEYQTMIAERTFNWEADRIALMDILLMKMALAEMCYFPTIPVKVSINEYIDISKEYSTPKSREFINGIIDKLATDLRSKGAIVKTGRGLIEQ